jgi:hypothetical protein
MGTEHRSTHRISAISAQKLSVLCVEKNFNAEDPEMYAEIAEFI